MKAARWFHCKCWPWKSRLAMTVKTTSDTTSWITLSWMSENGPHVPSKPMRLAGTWQQYSKKAIPHEKAITPIRGQYLLTPAS